MRKILSISLLSLILGFTTVYASTEGNDTKPLVGKWELWQGDDFYELEMDLYSTPPADGSYGYFSDRFEDTNWSFYIEDVAFLQENKVELIDKEKGKATLNYNPVSKQMTLILGNSKPIIFKQKDKYGYVITTMADKINVRSTPVSGTPIIKASRGQSFKFLGKKNGWFKVELSPTDKRIGYISPDYALYLKDNKIPDEALTKSYSNGDEGIWFQVKGDQVFMTEEITRNNPDGTSFLPIISTYIGKIVGNALVFTYSGGMLTDFSDINEMNKIDPYVLYYYNDADIFVKDGKNFSPDNY